MKTLIFTLITLIGLQVMAQETCQDVKQDVNTPVPVELKDAEIIVKTKDGKEIKYKANEFKVVKRQQQFKVKEKIVTVPCEPKVIVKEVVRVEKMNENKNLVMLGLRKDHSSYESSSNGNSVTVYSKKEPIFDIGYFRRNILDSNFGLGIGIDTNGTPKALIGLEF